MSRTYSKVKDPHRVLKLDPRSPQRGEDIHALQVASRRRLDELDIERALTVDAEFGKQSRDVFDTTAHFLGALEETTAKAIFPIGAQELIRFPGRRSDAQLQRSHDRIARLAKERDASKHEAAQQGHGVSGLNDRNRAEARARAIAAFDLAFDHRSAVHYTQSSARWQGIANGLRYKMGEYPHYADCSSMATWCLWSGLFVPFGVKDVVNGTAWTAGYTGTMLTHGIPVQRNLLPGDLVIYGHGFPGEHVAMYHRNGMVYSHGSEAGPFYIDMHYRGDIMSIRRVI